MRNARTPVSMRKDSRRATFLFQMRPSKLDKGYNAVTDVPFSELRHSDYPKFSGLALTRKWDGRKFVDDDNSTTDFEVKAASLSRKDANGNTIK